MHCLEFYSSLSLRDLIPVVIDFWEIISMQIEKNVS